VDIYTVSKLLGHSSVKVTERHYLALDPDHVREAVNHLNFDIPSSRDDWEPEQGVGQTKNGLFYIKSPFLL
jgi:hypothetical protein